MLHRRRFLGTGLSGTAAAMFISPNPLLGDLPPALSHEDLIGWVHRTTGGWNIDVYRRMLGAANAFKEGDAILGVAALSEDERQLARQLLANTTLGQIDAHPPFTDTMSTWLRSWIDADIAARHRDTTLGQLKTLLLEENAEDIQSLRRGLSSDVIACVVKLMSNKELTRVGAKVFHPLPGTRLGAKGYMGARIQPNSPTDDPEDIRWQVFNAFAYAVGDVLIGTNPVSSEPESVAAVEAVLQDILDTFDIAHLLPHCVLSHIDIQAQIERDRPGSTALWFQSIAGSDAANGTFDVSLDKLIRHAQSRPGPYALYFETGQGADFTNGHGMGTDMVIHESRKYGLARGLMQVVAENRQRQSLGSDAWVHVNDVAGFIGPEVFRSKEQLVRCCLEDIVMGKLHGLMIGLDVCTTLHMDVSLDDLEWCIDQIMPANPGYLMALPTRIDPMLGYLTTGYHDHVRIREKFGYRVEDRMWEFFQSLGVIDSDGKPTSHFGDPTWIYLQYCRRKGDARFDAPIQAEAAALIHNVRQRGVFIAEGYGDSTSLMAPELKQQVDRIYDDAKQCIWAELPTDFEQQWSDAIAVHTQSLDRSDYILHPASGEVLSERSLTDLTRLGSLAFSAADTVLVVSDGLNALAHTTDSQCRDLVDRLRTGLNDAGFRVAPSPLIVRSGRVRAGYRIGETLFKNRQGRCSVVHVVGERPGSGHRTLSIYLTSADGSQWSVPSTVDHNITKVVSGIARTAMQPESAAETAIRLLRQMA
jgi:ethanolamine ammonia-lyase large subunit